jgi:hypothetical protein
MHRRMGGWEVVREQRQHVGFKVQAGGIDGYDVGGG